MVDSFQDSYGVKAIGFEVLLVFFLNCTVTKNQLHFCKRSIGVV